MVVLLVHPLAMLVMIYCFTGSHSNAASLDTSRRAGRRKSSESVRLKMFANASS